MSNISRRLSWLLSLATVIALHLGLFLWALYWQPAMPVELPPAAMIVELEPLPALPPPAAPPPPPEEHIEEVLEEQPKLAEAPEAKIVVAKVEPKPKPKPKPKPRPKPPEPKPEPVEEPVDQPPSDAPVSASASESTPAAPQQAMISTPSQAEISWQSLLLSHLAKYKRYPEDARRRGLEGMNKLRFVVDGKGMVQSFALVGKSKSSSLDRATLQMIRRAQPLPPPPAEMLKDGVVEVVAPFIYSLERRR